MLKKDKIAMLAGIWLLVISIGLSLFYTTDKVNAAVESQTVISSTITVNTKEYKKNEKVSVYFALDNYDETFPDVITTMYIVLKFDAHVLEPIKEDFKKIAQDNGGLGYSHMEAGQDSITYQYLNIVNPLKKGTSELFCLKLNVLDDIPDIEKVISVNNVILQDGTKAESVRYKTETKFKISSYALDIAENESIGDKVYDATGELADKDKYQNENLTDDLQQELDKAKKEYATSKSDEYIQETESVSDKSSESSEISSNNPSEEQLNFIKYAVMFAVVCILILTGWKMYCVKQQKK